MSEAPKIELKHYPPTRQFQFDHAMSHLATSRENQLPELFLGIVRAQGADTEKYMLTQVEEELRAYGYKPVRVDIADLIAACAADLAGTAATDAPPLGAIATSRWESPATRVQGLMAWGDDLRGAVDPSIAAMMAIGHIAMNREEVTRDAIGDGHSGIAYLIRTLIQPAEIARLRSVYKQRFFLVGIHQDRDERIKRLSRQFINEGIAETVAQVQALEIIQIDEGISPSNAGTTGTINVNQTFQKSDVFLTVGRNRTLKRFCAQIFGNPHGAPTLPELGMAHAFLAAKQSVSLGRSVGASIFSGSGDLVAVGCNEAAKPGGGTYGEPTGDDDSDGRDHVIGHDPSDVQRISALYSFLSELTKLTTESVSDLTEDNPDTDTERARQRWLETLVTVGEQLKPELDRNNVRLMPRLPGLAGTRLMNLIEFGRSTHAEMAAITTAARRGISTQNTHMFVTTFPCHECTRNIVAAGIASLTFIEPYPKSLASELYRDSVEFHTEPTDPSQWNRITSKVRFAPFEGISPVRFDDLFSVLPRKHSLSEVATDTRLSEGGALRWKSGRQALRNSIRGYIDSEYDPLFEMARQLAEQSVILDLDQKYGTYKATFKRELGGVVE